jgi:hypothetical protein
MLKAQQEEEEEQAELNRQVREKDNIEKKK